jgi:hypothetical protein
VNKTFVKQEKLNPKDLAFLIIELEKDTTSFYGWQVKRCRFMLKTVAVCSIAKGLLADKPQRQRPKAVLPSKP